jgi:hypothetical protein
MVSANESGAFWLRWELVDRERYTTGESCSMIYKDDLPELHLFEVRNCRRKSNVWIISWLVRAIMARARSQYVFTVKRKECGKTRDQEA